MILIVRGHINGGDSKYDPSWPRISEFGLVKPYAPSARGSACLKKPSPTYVAWTGLTWAASSGASEIWV